MSKTKTFVGITQEQQQHAFIQMACELEPERLYCDGERSKTDANRVYKRIMKEWKALEKVVGRTVDQYEVYGWDN